MSNISAFGYVITIIASQTFPIGFTVTQGASDGDPLDMPSVKIGDLVLGVNGDPITWNKAIPLPMTLSVIPGSLDDINLSILANANRVAQGKSSAQDIITATIVYPDGSVTTLIQGAITDAPFGRSLSSDGRAKTRQFGFMFGDYA
jgi:hypothetical protein